MILWGIGMGAQDSCLKAALSHVVPLEKRSTGFGVFDTGFGIAWFAGSAVMGMLVREVDHGSCKFLSDTPVAGPPGPCDGQK